jgi:lipid-binding SYLF domain-containing protein
MRAAVAILFAAVVLTAGCETTPKTEYDRQELIREAKWTVKRFQEVDPGLKVFFETAKGYAVFPTVAKGGLVIGGAHGRGILFDEGRMIGYCDLSQGSIGAQIGGQGYSQVIFFQFEKALESFKRGEFAFSAQATGVAVKAGASETADYAEGVAVFTMVKGGLMGEASIGGQSFSYAPM